MQRLERPFLHAARLAFTHPTDGRRVEFESPLPPDLQSVIDDIQRSRTQERPTAADTAGVNTTAEELGPIVTTNSASSNGKVFYVDRDAVTMPNGRDGHVDVVRHSESVVLVPCRSPAR